MVANRGIKVKGEGMPGNNVQKQDLLCLMLTSHLRGFTGGEAHRVTKTNMFWPDGGT